MKTMFLGILTAIAFVAFGIKANAEEPKSKTVVFGEAASWLRISKDTVFNVAISDEVSDGCWTNAKATKNAVELEIKRSGFKLADGDVIASFNIYLTSLGFKKAGICVTTYELEVWRYIVDNAIVEGHVIKSIVGAPLWSNNGILTGGQSIIDGGLKSSFVNLIQEFLLKIDKGKKALVVGAKSSATDKMEKEFWENYKIE